eukprot:TRINITY_DN29952_c0_g1_i1.p1 TRINITY_DN29952_c0_g1~~TRINITY_DN29952_c0_g1_i1.p1  ORF type:complete len:271 (+),score=38.26 TRINITY_DN29952_c0_g1_i1:822-1634(+)
MGDPIKLEGWLNKKGAGPLSGWSKRYCVYTGKELHYYKDKEQKQQQGTLDVSNAFAQPHASTALGFTLQGPSLSRVYLLQALTQHDYDVWVASLRPPNRQSANFLAAPASPSTPTPTPPSAEAGPPTGTTTDSSPIAVEATATSPSQAAASSDPEGCATFFVAPVATGATGTFLQSLPFSTGTELAQLLRWFFAPTVREATKMHLQRALQFSDEGELLFGVIEVDAALEADPDCPQALLLASLIKRRMGFTGAADVDLARTAALDPAYPR